MHSLYTTNTLTEQYERSRRAADRYAVVTAARERRVLQRHAARLRDAAEPARPPAIVSWFWRRRWT